MQPLQVITNDDMNSIFILDGGLTSADRSTAKVLEFDKSGNFIRQYAFPKQFTNVRSFDISPKERKLWLLNADSVQEFDI